MKTHSFRVSRTISATRKRVYARWIDVQASKKYAVPEGCSIRSFTSDFRVGGDYRTVMTTPFGVMKSKGQYLEIIPGKKIRQTFVWDVPVTEVNFLTLEFKDQGKNTKLTLSGTRFESRSEAKSNAEGWASTLSRFAKSFEGE